MVILKIISYEIMPTLAGQERFKELVFDNRTKRTIIKRAYLLDEDGQILNEYQEDLKNVN